MIDSCVGADPGPTTGLCFLDYDSGHLVGRTVLQVDGGSAPVVLRGMLLAYYNTPHGIGRRAGSAEKFVTGQSAGSRGKAADVTRQLVMELAEVLQMFGYPVKIRPAADVKPWATDKRLAAAGIVPAGKPPASSLVHGWDAARHCLYGAKEAGIVADPLRKKTISGVHPDLVIRDELPGWTNRVN